MTKSLKLLTAGCTLAIALAAVACGQQQRPIPGHRQPWPQQPGRTGQVPGQTGQVPGQTHQAPSQMPGQVYGQIRTSQEAAEYLLGTQMHSFAGLMFMGAVETYNKRPSHGKLSLGVYEQAEGSQPHILHFDLVATSSSKTQLVFEGQYGHLVLNGRSPDGGRTFSGQASFAADGDTQTQALGSFSIEMCGFFTCRL